MRTYEPWVDPKVQLTAATGLVDQPVFVESQMFLLNTPWITTKMGCFLQLLRRSSSALHRREDVTVILGTFKANLAVSLVLASGEAMQQAVTVWFGLGQNLSKGFGELTITKELVIVSKRGSHA